MAPITSFAHNTNIIFSVVGSLSHVYGYSVLSLPRYVFARQGLGSQMWHLVAFLSSCIGIVLLHQEEEVEVVLQSLNDN